MLLIVLSLPLTETNSKHVMYTERDYGEVSSDNTEQISGLHSPHVEPKVQKSFGASSISQLSYLNSQTSTNMDSSANVDSSGNASLDQEGNHRNVGGDIETIKRCDSFFSTISGQVRLIFKKLLKLSLSFFLACKYDPNTSVQSDMQAEVEQLRLEIQNTVALYERACEELVHAQINVRGLISW